MTERERILAAIRGAAPDRLPWTPRLEFWYRGRLRNGTLPPELRSLNLVEIADRLGVGYYASVPDFTDCVGDIPNMDRGLGLLDSAVIPFEVELENVDRRVTQHGNETAVEYHTPVGSIRTAIVFTEEMLGAGASQPYLAERAIREPRDIDVVGYIFSHSKVKPRLKHYLALREKVGERGVVVAFANGAACPIHFIMKELLTTEQFFYAMADYPAKLQWLAEQIDPFFANIKEIAASTPAEVVLLGGNYDDAITTPAFYKRHILPALHDYGELLHRRGKYLMTHTDGENRRLVQLYLESGFDIADSVCPYPMTRLHLNEILETFDGRITVWGGIPCTMLCADSASTDQFRRFIEESVERYRGRTRLILGVSDMVTVDAEWDRLNYITECVQRHG